VGFSGTNTTIKHEILFFGYEVGAKEFFLAEGWREADF
jgi:hypothetical protein